MSDPGPQRYPFARRAAGTGVAAGLAATVLGAGGRVWWFLDLFTTLRAQHTVLLAVGTAVSAAVRARGLALLGALGQAVNAATVAPLFRPRDVPALHGPRFTLASWNVLRTNTRFGEVIGHVAALDADIVFLLEAYGDWAARLRAAGVPFTVHEPEDIPEGGFLILTRDPAASLTVRLPEERPLVEVALPVDGSTVRVVGVHTSAPVDAARAGNRGRQLRMLAGLAAEGQDPLVAIGDLNATTWSHEFRTLEREGGLVNSLRGFGLQPSWPVWAPRVLRVAIDHALHTPDLVVLSRSVGPAAGSDHCLLQVTLALR